MKFKVGDRVEYIGNDPLDPLSYGDKGTVIALGERGIHDVEWDKGNSRMHGNCGDGRNYHCWSVIECEIRKVKEEKKMTSNEVINVLMKKLDVEVDELFDIEEENYSPYYFDKDGMLVDRTGDDSCEECLAKLIYGVVGITKIPVKEMTVSEIEKELGYKIKVVEDKEETK